MTLTKHAARSARLDTRHRLRYTHAQTSLLTLTLSEGAKVRSTRSSACTSTRTSRGVRTFDCLLNGLLRYNLWPMVHMARRTDADRCCWDLGVAGLQYTDRRDMQDILSCLTTNRDTIRYISCIYTLAYCISFYTRVTASRDTRTHDTDSLCYSCTRVAVAVYNRK